METITLSNGTGVHWFGLYHVVVLSVSDEDGQFEVVFHIWRDGGSDTFQQTVVLGGQLRLTESTWALTKVNDNPAYRPRSDGDPPGGPGQYLLTLEQVSSEDVQ